MERFLQDLRYGARSFLRQPGFTLTAILALALGIGANTAVFSVVHAVLLKPLPYPDPDALLIVRDTYPAVPNASVSFGKFETLRARTQTLQALGAMTRAGLTLTGNGDPEEVPGARVSADFLTALGVRPLLGRTFTPDEDLPNGPPAIVISHQLWQRRFGGDPAVLNMPLPVNGVPRTIVGIMPEGREYPVGAQAWIPLGIASGTSPGGNFLTLLGRMRPTASIGAVRQDLASISDDFNTQTGNRRDVLVTSLHETQVSNNRRMLLILQGTVAFVLLVACANVANLLLARSMARRRELAIRSAIGAGRRRIVQQVLTESILLGIAGGLAGVLLAGWLMRVFLALSPRIAGVQQVAIDGRVLLFTLAVAVFTGVLFGLAPARQGFRTNPNDSLRDGGTRAATGSSKGASRVLVTAEIALALILVVGAGLLVKSLLRIQGENPGYATRDVFTFDLSLPVAKYPDAAPRDALRRVLTEIRSIPGVRSAGAINYVPTIGFGFNGPFSIVGAPPFEADRAPVTEYRLVTPEYFKTLDIPILRGQDFSDQDGPSGRPVVIINQTMAERYFEGIDPIGAQMQLGMESQSVVREVIGVVADVRDLALNQPPVAEVFVPHAQVPINAMGIVLRLAGETTLDGIVPAVRGRLAAVDPDLPMIRPQLLQRAVEATAGNARMVSVLTAGFALLAAILASVGIYSLIAYSVEGRRREIGIRLALGAGRRNVVALVVGEGLVLAAAGVVIGLAGAYLLTHTLQTLLYEVEPTDPIVLASTCAGVFGVALIASIVPALRALRVDPMIALRAE